MRSVATTWVAPAVFGCVLAATMTPIPAAQGADDGALPGGITLKSSMKAYTGFDGRLLSNDGNQLNPQNAVLGVPAETWLEDLRPVFKMETDAGLSAVVKPHLSVTGSWVTATPLTGGPQGATYSQNINFEWNEAYARWMIGDSLSVAAGTQNIQWGPAELFSPSNEIFHFFFDAATPLFYLRGKNLFQSSWTPSRDTSLVLLAEYAPNNDPQFQAQQPFVNKALLKGETSFTTGESARSHTLGAVVGTDEAHSSWLGEYGSFSMTDAFSLYFDASENFRKTAYYPNTLIAPGSVVMAGPEGANTGVFPRVLLGGRYAFPKSIELCVEYLYNDLGWTSEQYKQALGSIADPVLGAQNFARFVAPGLDFRGRDYLYASLRIGDLGHKDKATFFLRYLMNLTDQSGSAIGSVEYTPGNRWTLLAAAIAETGPANAELTQIEQAEFQTALRLDF